MKSFKVFGIGLSRTGTLSLSTALTGLGWKSVHFPDDGLTMRQLTSGSFHLDVLSHHDALCDTPAAAFFPQFDKIYPNSKFILTVRGRDAWHDSVREFWARDAEAQARAFERYINSSVYGTWLYSRDRFDYAYDRHLREVENYFRREPSKLLVMDICGGDGWRKLGDFLGCDVPNEPFPHAHASATS